MGSRGWGWVEVRGGGGEVSKIGRWGGKGPCTQTPATKWFTDSGEEIRHHHQAGV